LDTIGLRLLAAVPELQEHIPWEIKQASTVSEEVRIPESLETRLALLIGSTTS
jgi:hypothetical protein